jgi:hypothetical protein
MSVLLATAGLVLGLTVGWFGHRRAWTWCSRCGHRVGSLCFACRERERHLAQAVRRPGLAHARGKA